MYILFKILKITIFYLNVIKYELKYVLNIIKKFYYNFLQSNISFIIYYNIVFIFQHLAWHIPTSSSHAKPSVLDKVFLKLHRELVLLFKNESYLHFCYLLPHHPKCGNYL